MVNIPPIKMVMIGEWFMALFYPHYLNLAIIFSWTQRMSWTIPTGLLMCFKLGSHCIPSTQLRLEITPGPITLWQTFT